MPTSARCEMFSFLGIRGDVGIAPYKITFLLNPAIPQCKPNTKGLTIFSVSPFCVKNSVYFAGSFLDTAVVSLPFSETIFSACMPRMTTPPMRKNTMLKVSRLIAA